MKDFKMSVINIVTGEEINDGDLLVHEADTKLSCKYECCGMQDDGSPVIFDKCGNFSYLDPEKYRIAISFE